MRTVKLVLDASELRRRSQAVILFLVTFQHFRDRVIGGVDSFFSNHYHYVNGELVAMESDEFRRKVLTKAKHKFEACLLWYEDMEVISVRDTAVALKLVEYRNDIAHDPSRVLMSDKYRGWALERVDRLLRKIDAFWIQVEVETDPDVPNDYDRGSATTVFRLLLNNLSGALAEKP